MITSALIAGLGFQENIYAARIAALILIGVVRMSDVVKEICQDCEKVFESKGYAFLCPECRKERIREGLRNRWKKIKASEKK